MNTTNKNDLQLKDFVYDLDDELIAQKPLQRRTDSKLLIRSKDGSLLDSRINQLYEHIPKGSIIIVNNSRVFPSRLLGKTPTGGKAEIFLLEHKKEYSDENVWLALGRPTRKFSEGYQINFENGLVATIKSKPDTNLDTPTFLVSFNLSENDFNVWLDQYGYTPLPPYIVRKDPKQAPVSTDTNRYQTVYADKRGSVAAPTAGLHFNDELIKKLKEKNIEIRTVTLHVGAGTFLPVKSEDLDRHIMHRERYLISEDTYNAINKGLKEGRKVIAVGTTSLRCLEAFQKDFAGREKEGLNRWNDTDLFIRPRTKDDIYRPKLINGLMTNFHQPGSTLYMLVSALIGFGAAKEAYEHAKSKKYRFFSYGDACLFWL